MDRTRSRRAKTHTFEQSHWLAIQRMPANFRFSDLLNAAHKAWGQGCSDESLLSLAMPLDGVDPLQALPKLGADGLFKFLWDNTPGLCLAASGRCQQLELTGARRFELAQRFCDLTLARLHDGAPQAPAQARPRVLLAFSFFEESTERKIDSGTAPSVQAVLPRWQLSRHGQHGWLRVNATVSSFSEARELAEQCWLMAEAVQEVTPNPLQSNTIQFHPAVDDWQDRYRAPLHQAINLVETGQLHKLVLAVRNSVKLTAPLNPLPLLRQLRHQQTNSCRFLWQRNPNDSFFGASPERLLSLRGGYLRSDALAGTACENDDGERLLRSEKDRLEHELVVKTITKELQHCGLTPWRRRDPRLSRHGSLTHLHTPITAHACNQAPLKLAKKLHPTPAVAGLPGREAMAWLRVLEPFERGNYAAPIGWIDSQGDAELRVAIRCGHAIGHQMDLTAGAGLVRGSCPEREMQEINLKLHVLVKQLDAATNLNARDA